MTVAGEGTVSVQAVESEGSDYPNHPRMSRMSRSPAPHTLPSMGQSAAQYLVPCSPSCSPPWVPSPGRRLQGLRSRPSSSHSSSGSKSRSGSASGYGRSSSSELGSDDESGTGSPGSGSGGLQRSRSSFPDIVFLGENEEEEEISSDDEEMLSQGTVSSLDISNSDNEETCKAAACKKAHQSDVLYAAW